jgi:hypothetical protein
MVARAVIIRYRAGRPIGNPHGLISVCRVGQDLFRAERVFFGSSFGLVQASLIQSLWPQVKNETDI